MIKMRMTLLVTLKKKTMRVIISLKLMRVLTDHKRRIFLGILLKSLPIINKPLWREPTQLERNIHTPKARV